MQAYTVELNSSTATLICPTAAQAAALTGPRVGAAGAPTSFHLSNGTGGIVYIGGSDVDTTDGFPLADGDSIEIDLIADALYGIVASGTPSVNVLVTNSLTP